MTFPAPRQILWWIQRTLKGAPPKGFLFANLVAWLGWMLAAYQPGLMSNDSFLHLKEGLTGHYSNWQPPLNAWLMGGFSAWAGTPWPVLVLQLVALGSGFIALAKSPRTGSTGWVASLVVVFTLWCPPVWAVGVTLWKDVWMACALLWGVNLIRRQALVEAGLCLFTAQLFRVNAVFAILPLLLVWSVALSCQLGIHSKFKAAGVFVVAFLAIAVVPKAIEKAADVTETWPMGSLIAFDLVGVYHQNPALMSGSVLEEDVSPGELRVLYWPRSVSPIFWSDSHRVFNVTRLPERRSRLIREWFSVIASHPGLYLRHRWMTFASLLSLGQDEVDFPYQTVTIPNDRGITQPNGLGFQASDTFRTFFRNTVLFRGSFWLACLLLAGVLGVGLRRSPDGLMLMWVALSGLCYLLAYFFVGVGSDFRYLYWPALAAFSGAILFVEILRVRMGMRETQTGVPHAPVGLKKAS
jgi:hypothetical protein